MIRLPNLIIVGAAKSGTTTLFHELKREPNIFIPEIKECRYFSKMPINFKGGEAAEYQNEGPRNLKAYLDLFKDREEDHILDISNDYFYYYRKTIKNIKYTYRKLNIQEPKILIILRDPIYRVFSMYNHIIRLNSDVLSFDKAFEMSSTRIKNNYAWMFDLKGVGMSYNPCKEYLNNFDKVKIIFFDDLNSDKLFNSIYDFVGIKKSFSRNILNTNINNYQKPKSLLFNWLLSQLKNFFINIKIFNLIKNTFFYKYLGKFYFFLLNLNKGKTKIKLKEYQIKKLSRFYKLDIIRLSNLLKVDLSHWIPD